MPTQLKIDDAKIRRALDTAGDKMFPYLYAGLRRGVARYRKTFLAGRHLPGRDVKLKGGRKGMKTWAFKWRARPRNESSGKLDDIRVEFYSTSYVAATLEFGATIRPKGRMLAIPAGHALTKSGKPKKGWRSPAQARGRGYKLHVIPRRGSSGPYLAVDLNAPKGRSRRKGARNLRVVFALTKSVRIRPRLGFYRGWDAFAPQRQKRIMDEVDNYLRKHFGMPPKSGSRAPGRGRR